MSAKYKLNSCVMSVLGRVLEKVAQYCDITIISHHGGMGASIAVEFDENPRRQGVIEVLAGLTGDPQPVQVTVGYFGLKVSSAAEIDQAEQFRSEPEFLRCFKRIEQVV